MEFLKTLFRIKILHKVKAFEEDYIVLKLLLYDSGWKKFQKNGDMVKFDEV